MIKRPLVLSHGHLEQLQKGDILIPSPDRIPLINDDPDPIIIGTPVYISSNYKFKKAKADNIITTNPIGLCFDNKLVQTNGTIFSNQWPIEELGGLIPGKFYYLSDLIKGKITKKPPIIPGHFVIQIGIAISKTRFEIRIGTPIKC